ncbi:MAG: glucose-1-phosphate thymidylyltransferase [Rickettsiales bacterium]|nr:glucose-1-phosphate thymidylyltransferase [Rickettsiales bacterium]
MHKGIILAGGYVTRLSPLTNVVCKQLLPIYDKPVIYYPLTMLLLSSIKEILIISTEESNSILQRVLGDGSRFGISLQYASQEKPNGIAEAFIIAEKFLNGSPCVMILGDNILNKSQIGNFINKSICANIGATIFGVPVHNPESYGVIEFEKTTSKVISIEEKPLNPKSNIAAIGLYIYDETVVEKSKSLKPSDRGELEITDLNNLYLSAGTLQCSKLSRGDFWVDVGTYDTMNDASNYIRLQQKYTGQLIGSPEEAAYNMGYISKQQLFDQTVQGRKDIRYKKKILEHIDD